MITTVGTVGSILLVGGVIALGPTMALLAPHPTRASLTTQRWLRRAAIAAHLLALLFAAAVLVPGTDASMHAGTGVNRSAAAAPATDQSVPAVGANERTDRRMEMESGSARRDVAPGGADEDRSNAEQAPGTGDAIPVQPASAGTHPPGGAGRALFGLVDPASATYLRFRARAERVARTAGMTAVLGTAVGGFLLAALALRQHRTERRLRSGATRRRIGRCTLYLSGAVRTPGSVGVLWPRIYVPAWVMQDPSRRRAVLAHECHHARRLDGLRLIGDVMLQAIFWWSPAAHLIATRGRVLREMAADADAARRTGTSSYRSVLVDVASAAGRQPPRWLAAFGTVFCLQMASGSVRNRLRRVLGSHERRSRRGAWAGVTAAALALSLTLGACAGIRPEASYTGLPLQRYSITEYEDDHVSATTRFYDADGTLWRTTITVYDGPAGTVLSTTYDATEKKIAEHEAEYARRLHRYPDNVRNAGNSVGPHISSGMRVVYPSPNNFTFAQEIGGQRHSAAYHYLGEDDLMQGFSHRRLTTTTEQIDDHGQTIRVRQTRIDGTPWGPVNEREYDGRTLVRNTLRSDDGALISVTEIERAENGAVTERRSSGPGGLVEITRYEYDDDRYRSYWYQAPDASHLAVPFPSERFPFISGSGSTKEDKWVSLHEDAASGFAVAIYREHAEIATEAEVRRFIRDLLIEFHHHLPTLEATYARHVAERGPVSGVAVQRHTVMRELWPAPGDDITGALQVLAGKLVYTTAMWNISNTLFAATPALSLSVPLRLELTDAGPRITIDGPGPVPAPIPAGFPVPPADLLEPGRPALSIGMRIHPSGVILDPYIRSWEGDEPTPEEERAIVDALWARPFAQAVRSGTGFDEPVVVVLTIRRDAEHAALWAPDPEVEAWLRTMM